MRRNISWRNKNRKEKQNGMQFSRVFPPHVSSAVFLAGRVTHRKNTGTQCSLYLNTKGKHFSLEFGLQRLIGGLHERWALCWFVPWMKSLQAEMFFCHFSFSSGAIMEFPWRKGSKASENVFGEEAVDAGDGKLMWSLRVASFHHFWNYLARTLILADFCSAELREPKPLGQFI